MIRDNQTRMYSHAFATLLLSESYGMTNNPAIKRKLKAAINLLIRGAEANEWGGWRYQPMPRKTP